MLEERGLENAVIYVYKKLGIYEKAVQLALKVLFPCPRPKYGTFS
jgi:hypothetical protein